MLKKRTIKIMPQASIAALSGFGDLLAGFILGSLLPTGIPWAAALYPPLIGARGAIAGSIIGRLTSALNVGLIEPNLSKENEKLWEILSSGISASILASIIASIPLIISGLSIHPITVVLVSLVTINGSTLLLIPLNLGISFFAFKRGLDPDIIVYPTMSTIADIVVTLLYLISLRMTLDSLIMFSAILVGISFIVVIKWAIGEFIKVLLEVLTATTLVIMIESVAGLFLGETLAISDKRVLFIYPVMLTELGDFSSIIGSLITTRLFLGMARRKIPLLDIFPEILGVFTVYLGVFSFIGGVLWLLRGNPWVSILTFLIAFPVMLVITNLVVVLSSRRFDPDNFTIPITTSSADLVTTAAMTAAVSIIGG